MKHITLADVKISYNHNGSKMHKFTVPCSITETKAKELQTEAGYHPAGYGFYSYDPTLTETTWLCSNNCD